MLYMQTMTPNQCAKTQLENLQLHASSFLSRCVPLSFSVSLLAKDLSNQNIPPSSLYAPAGWLAAPLRKPSKCLAFLSLTFPYESDSDPDVLVFILSLPLDHLLNAALKIKGDAVSCKPPSMLCSHWKINPARISGWVTWGPGLPESF